MVCYVFTCSNGIIFLIEGSKLRSPLLIYKFHKRGWSCREVRSLIIGKVVTPFRPFLALDAIDMPCSPPSHSAADQTEWWLSQWTGSTNQITKFWCTYLYRESRRYSRFRLYVKLVHITESRVNATFIRVGARFGVVRPGIIFRGYWLKLLFSVTIVERHIHVADLMGGFQSI